MKVLQISNKIPYPEKDGGVIAINAITEGLLKAGCEVKVFAMNTRKHFIEIRSIPEKFRNDRHLETITIDTDVKPLSALIALLTGKSYNISRFKSEDFSKKLTAILKKESFDIIHLEGLYLAPYLPIIKQYSKAPVIMRAHNIEWKIWHKLASEEKGIVKKWYLTKLSKQLKIYEESVIDLFDGIATITNTDLEYWKKMGCKTPMAHIPFGVDLSTYVPGKSKYPNSLFYIGALDWLPNLQGIDWFLKNVWTNILTKFPDVQFHIAGRNMPDSLRNGNYPNVVFHGEVEDAKVFMEDYDIMLVPLLAGSGVRIKIIEGMAMEKPIITTSVGIEGIECKLGRDVLVADEPAQFAEAVCHCIEDKTFKEDLGKLARKFIEENGSIDQATAKLIGFYNERILQKQ
jgi:glycosyltransferase involved in cell wall biosynthesis